MAVKVYKPVTPGLRGMTGYTFDEITKSTPERSLIVMRKKMRRAQQLWAASPCAIRAAETGSSSVGRFQTR